MPNLVVAFCTFNRAPRLPGLVAALRAQRASVPFDILAVDNNSSDETPRVLAELAAQDGPRLAVVRETTQGIAPARNRALAEARDYDYLLFLDDDELPRPGFVAAALAAFAEGNVDCVGGRVHVSFAEKPRPAWLTDDLLGHYAQIDYGNEPFWISDPSRPIWTANCGYRMAIFGDPGLRFDNRYSRHGHAVGGGSDAVMFRSLLSRNMRIRYVPAMEVDHFVEPWRMTRSYFLKLRFVNGQRQGQHAMADFPRSVFDIPPFLVRETASVCLQAGWQWLRRAPRAFGATLDASYRVGMLRGRIRRWRQRRHDAQSAVPPS